MGITKAVIPAAGKGARLQPATRVVAKELFPVLDTPLIQLVVEEAVNSGIEEIVIVVSEPKKTIRDYFQSSHESEKDNGKIASGVEKLRWIHQQADIRFVEQSEQKGLGHAVLMAASEIGDVPFAVLLGDNLTRADTPVTSQLASTYDQYKGAVIGVEDVSPRQINRYGIVETEWQKSNVYKIASLIEKPEKGTTNSTLAIAGRYILPGEIFKILHHTNRGRGGEIQLTDAIATLADNGSVYACEYAGQRLDLGSRVDFTRANLLAALDRPELREETIRMLSEIQSALESEKIDD